MQPEDIDALLDRANRLLEGGKPAESLRCLDEIQEDELDAEDRIEWASLRAWALSELGRDEEALQTLDPLLEEFPKSARLLGTLGVVLSNTDDLEDARDALEEAVELSPDDEVALANLALVYEKLRDYKGAINLYDKALSLGADIDWILQRKAAALSELGDYGGAKVALKRYLSLAPDDASQWIALAILHSDDEEYDEAFRCYEQAEQLDPNLASLRLNWGVTAVRAHRLPLARTQLRHLQRLEPRSTRPLLLRAFILEEDAQLPAARAIYERILTRTRFADRGEMHYAFEMAMDFFARQKLHARCERLLARAYAANACTVELCEAYREVAGAYLAKGFWYSIMVECNYREGLSEVHEPAEEDEEPRARPTRFVRAFQVVARNHDEAVSLAVDFVGRMGEQNPAIREFVGEEPIDDAYTGIYEVETDSYVFADDRAEAE
ncbi:MAG: tetratricopeptide repeat protein [Planctomycetota bacterium]